MRIAGKEWYQLLVNHYYDLVTDIYEFGWGSMFHFAPRHQSESFRSLLLRHEHKLADRLSLAPGIQLLDVRHWVVGTLARNFGASFAGINKNAYQIKRAKVPTRDAQSLCRFIHCDHMQIPEDDNRTDAAFVIEVTARVPIKTAVFRTIFRVLHPGACFAGYEWYLAEAFDVRNAKHKRIKKDVMAESGLLDITSTSDTRDALRLTGLDLLEARDLAPESHPSMPWYRALQGRDFNLRSIPLIPIARALTNVTLRVREKLRLVPEGTTAVSTILNAGADTLVEGGESGVLTPMLSFWFANPEPRGTE